MTHKHWRSRGRPPDTGHSYKDSKILGSLARIAVKQGVESSDLFNGLLDAWNNEEAECQKLRIHCRKKAKDSGIFLFTIGRKVVGQFPIPTPLLQGNNQLESYVRTIRSKRVSSVKNVEGENVRITDLQAGMRKVSLTAEVVEVPESKVVYTRFGTTPSVSNVLIEDETGSIRMSLWNQQINKVHEGNVITVTNGKVAWFRGEQQLSLGRSGSLSVIK